MSNYPPPVAKGSLGKAKNRRSDNSPDYVGSITIDVAIPAGTKLWLVGWNKTSRDNGDRFISLAAEYPKDRQGGNDAPRRPAPQGDFLDDEIPF